MQQSIRFSITTITKSEILRIYQTKLPVLWSGPSMAIEVPKRTWKVSFSLKPLGREFRKECKEIHEIAMYEKHAKQTEKNVLTNKAHILKCGEGGMNQRENGWKSKEEALSNK